VPANPDPDSQQEVIAFLSRAGDAGPVRRIDTHCAMIFLAGSHAFKLKRAVNLGYLDFSTAAKRHAACAAELVLNRRTAPDLYLALRPLRRAADGTLELGPDVPPEVPADALCDSGALDWAALDWAALDWVVEMRRFPDHALLADLAQRGELTPALLRALADAVARFHEAAEVASQPDGVERIARVIAGNRAAMAALPSGALPQGDCALLGQRWQVALAAHAPLLARRAAQGHVRHCHGDLHLANICLWHGQPTLFDALEFDPDLATTDVLYDLAFLVMDLCKRGLAAAANLVLNRYLDRRPQEQDALPAMGLFLSLRAGIRAHVEALVASHQPNATAARQRSDEARRYLALALAVLEPVPPRLIAIGGLSGSGKSTLAGALAPLAGAAPGARWLRSDVIRKRLAGVDPETRLPPESYTPEASDRVYADMFDEAASLLGLGQTVVVDAVFARHSEREAIARVAADAGVPFTGLWLEAPGAVLAERVSARASAPQADASDADAAVVAHQLGYSLGSLEGWHQLDAGGPPEAILAAARALLGPAGERP
jgi:aminoglycoside phosphotransferase family enzyme/predicted kinase